VPVPGHVRERVERRRGEEVRRGDGADWGVACGGGEAVRGASARLARSSGRVASSRSGRRREEPRERKGEEPRTPPLLVEPAGAVQVVDKSLVRFALQELMRVQRINGRSQHVVREDGAGEGRSAYRAVHDLEAAGVRRTGWTAE